MLKFFLKFFGTFDVGIKKKGRDDRADKDQSIYCDLALCLGLEDVVVVDYFRTLEELVQLSQLWVTLAS